MISMRLYGLYFLFVKCFLIFILIQFKKYDAINPAILVMYGMPTFLSGIILKFKPLLIGGIMLLGICRSISLLLMTDFQLLLMHVQLLQAGLFPAIF